MFRGSFNRHGRCLHAPTRRYTCGGLSMRHLIPSSLFGLLLTLVACGGSSGGGDGSGGGAGSNNNGAPGGGGAGSSCTCDITQNGVEKSVNCGESSCVNGEQYACGMDGSISDQGACTTAST